MIFSKKPYTYLEAFKTQWIVETIREADRMIQSLSTCSSHYLVKAHLSDTDRDVVCLDLVRLYNGELTIDVITDEVVKLGLGDHAEFYISDSMRLLLKNFFDGGFTISVDRVDPNGNKVLLDASLLDDSHRNAQLAGSYPTNS